MAASSAFPNSCIRHQPSSISPITSAPARTNSPAAPPSAPAATHGTRRPCRDRVRSEIAPNAGFATTDTAAPTPVTSPNTNSLLPGATASDCFASSTWIGPSHAANTPTFASTTAAVHRARTGTVGSARAAGTTPGSGIMAGSGRSASRNQWYDAFGVRTCVAKSTCTRPNRCEYPAAHSKLSSNDHWKYPRTSIPSSIAARNDRRYPSR